MKFKWEFSLENPMKTFEKSKADGRKENRKDIFNLKSQQNLLYQANNSVRK